MEFVINAELTLLEIYELGKLLGYTINPTLLWDPDRIVGNTDYIKSKFGPGTTIIYDNLPILWTDNSLFPPSIDSMFVMKTMNEQGFTNKNYDIITDVGAGTGVLGLYLLKNNPNIKKCISTDYQESAKDAVRINSLLNNLEDRIEFKQGNGLLTSADLIISNPPYIPETPIMKKERGLRVNPYQGTDLIEQLIQKHNTEMLLQASSVCAQDLELLDPDYERKIIAEMPAPARFTFLKPEHRAYLIDIGALEIENPQEFINHSTDNGNWPVQNLFILHYV